VEALLLLRALFILLVLPPFSAFFARRLVAVASFNMGRLGSIFYNEDGSLFFC